jgi:membrane fusion protein (multidrug efflux system)
METKLKTLREITGKTQGDVIEILEGISEGDMLIQAGARSVKNGQEVKISE